MEQKYYTDYGVAYTGDSKELLKSLDDNSVNLVITSPPFILQRNQEYEDKTEEEYIEWLSEFGRLIKNKLKDNGSFVLNLGGAYQTGVPIRSLYNYKILIKFCEELGFHLAEEFFWYNSSKLPSSIEWVNKEKVRTKDSVNTVWWFSKTPFPKADVRNVLVPYSDRMQKLLKDGKKYYDPKERPSGHNISEGFNKDNGGTIPSNLLKIYNSESNSIYLKYCKELKVKEHLAKFPQKLPEFFIKYLTDPGDLVVDIFSGSNTTGEVAESLGRRWLSCEFNDYYTTISFFRFCKTEEEADNYYNLISNKEYTDLCKTGDKIMPFLDSQHREKVIKVENIWENLKELNLLAEEHGIKDIFQDNGGKILQQLIYLNFKALPGRGGNDAIDEKTNEWEMKSVNIDTSARAFSTHHHLKQNIIDKYRSIPWSFAIYRGIELDEIYVISPKDLEPFFSSWERQLERKLIEEDKDHLNNPKIGIKFVKENGTKVYPIDEFHPFNPADIM